MRYYLTTHLLIITISYTCKQQSYLEINNLLKLNNLSKKFNLTVSFPNLRLALVNPSERLTFNFLSLG